MRLLASAGIGIFSMIAAASAAPMTNDMDLIYGKYQMAIRAAQLCRYMKHDAAQWAKMGPYIDAKVNHEIGGGQRLTLIEEAKSGAWKAARVEGCESEGTKTLLSLYDAELAPLAK